MVEVKRFTDTVSAKFVVWGGKRTTSYDDVKACVARVKSLAKKGKVIVRIRRDYDGTVIINMGEPADYNVVHNVTPAFQSVHYMSNQIRLVYHGYMYVRAIDD